MQCRQAVPPHAPVEMPCQPNRQDHRPPTSSSSGLFAACRLPWPPRAAAAAPLPPAARPRRRAAAGAPPPPLLPLPPLGPPEKNPRSTLPIAAACSSSSSSSEKSSSSSYPPSQCSGKAMGGGSASPVRICSICFSSAFTCRGGGSAAQRRAVSDGALQPRSAQWSTVLPCAVLLGSRQAHCPLSCALPPLGLRSAPPLPQPLATCPCPHPLAALDRVIQDEPDLGGEPQPHRAPNVLAHVPAGRGSGSSRLRHREGGRMSVGGGGRQSQCRVDRPFKPALPACLPACMSACTPPCLPAQCHAAGAAAPAPY